MPASKVPQTPGLVATTSGRWDRASRSCSAGVDQTLVLAGDRLGDHRGAATGLALGLLPGLTVEQEGPGAERGEAHEAGEDNPRHIRSPVGTEGTGRWDTPCALKNSPTG